MPTDPSALLALASLILVSAVLYSSVGHAGASAYLASMALFSVAPEAMKPAALVMNIVVAIAGTARFTSARLVPWPLLLPLLAGSIPAAFAGGAIDLPSALLRLILGLVLLFAAVRLWARLGGRPAAPPPRAVWLALLGAGLGFVAGLTGIGGGIFLSPILILTGWEEPRRTAGASVTFILANSIAGLLGHFGSGRGVPPGIALLCLVALGGGLYGSWLGARRLTPLTLRRLLAVVLLIAGGKLLLGR